MFFGGFPFDGAGMGGMGGHAGPRKEVDNETFYKHLGVEKTASQEEIKKAFKKLAIKHHPDKGGDQEKFKELCTAYEVLSDPEKRRSYDEYGEEGIETGGAGPGESIFEMFFGGGRGARRGPARSDDVNHKVAFSLEEFFNGTSKQMAINHNIICSECDGRGGPADAIQSCSECNGQGMKVLYQRMGPMIRQSTNPCTACRTTGKRVVPDKQCKKCDGRGLVRERKVVELNLPRGAPEGHRVVCRGEADQVPGEMPGDVVFTCSQKEHDVYQRSGKDLIMRREVTLKEALCGSGFFVKTLDGEQKWLSFNSAAPITPGKILAVENEGMPVNGSMFVRGHLFIKFEVKFPDSLSAPAKNSLASALPGPECLTAPRNSSAEVVEMSFIDPSTMGGNNKHGHDDDDEEEGQPGNVQCRQA